MRIWRGRVLWRGFIHLHPHSHTQLKKSGILIPSQCGDFPSKWGRVRTIPTGTGLFAISNQKISVRKIYVKVISISIWEDFGVSKIYEKIPINIYEIIFTLVLTILLEYYYLIDV